jgi:diacylglycerol kinase (ATP)
VAILLELARLRPREVTLILDGEQRTLPVTLVAVGNTSSYGGALRICPGADPGDGCFDVTVVGPMTRRELVRNRPRLADGTHVTDPVVQVLRASRVGLAAEGISAWADGEPLGPLPVTAGCVAGALRVVGGGRA